MQQHTMFSQHFLNVLACALLFRPQIPVTTVGPATKMTAGNRRPFSAADCVRMPGRADERCLISIQTAAGYIPLH